MWEMVVIIDTIVRLYEMYCRDQLMRSLCRTWHNGVTNQHYDTGNIYEIGFHKG